MSPLTAVTCYTVRCDRCDKSADAGTDYAAWSDRDGAEFAAEEADWFSVDHAAGERWFCLDCAPICPECGAHVREHECRDWTLA